MNFFWQAPMEETLAQSRKRFSNADHRTSATEWLERYSDTAPTASNQGASAVPFQRWFRFKEAYSPKFVADTLSSLPYTVNNCLDAFGGSGTTAVTCHMLGIGSTSIEVNPFLADLIESKITTVSPAAFRAAYEKTLSNLNVTEDDLSTPSGLPATFLEPGVNERYVFSTEVFSAVRAILRSSKSLAPDMSRLLRVLIGSVLVENSNVIINGKGRRYRRGWQKRPKTEKDLISSLDNAVDAAVDDLALFGGGKCATHRVLRGDARQRLQEVESADVAIFSPPYPNSFDYTDVYNLELWMLGYLNSVEDNRRLRSETLRSHVQIKWEPTPNGTTSKTLTATVAELREARAQLWNRNIPEMVGYYFDDLVAVFEPLRRILQPGRHVIVAIGDSRYANIHIDVGTILTECLKLKGFRLTQQGAMRSMRTSSQHGGQFALAEHCLVYERI